jgi:formylmethanofuran dehydrogenase subunit A
VGTRSVGHVGGLRISVGRSVRRDDHAQRVTRCQGRTVHRGERLAALSAVPSSGSDGQVLQGKGKTRQHGRASGSLETRSARRSVT